MTPAELDALAATLGCYFDPDFVFFAYVQSEPVGFVMGVPDLNQVLQKAAARPGIPEFITLLRALWYWKIRPVVDWVRIPLLGVKPEYRRKGVDVALYGTLLEAIINSRRIEHSDTGWIGEANYPMAGVARSLGLEHYKTYRLYEKRFTTSRREANERESVAPI
jgi:GNAT superfamily N-acetyltransferase